MESIFKADFFRANRQKLRTLFTGTAPIVLTANGLLQRAADETFNFKQDGSFWYLTGLDDPNVVLVMDKGKEYLIIPELSHSRIMFDGAIEPETLAAISGISEILSEKEGWKRLGARLKRVNNVAVLSPSPSFIEPLGMYTNPARRYLIRKMKTYNANLTLLDLRQHFQRMRMVKQPEEIVVLSKAIDITVKALKKAESKFRKQQYQNEFEIELDLSKNFRQAGAKGYGFEPVIAGGSKTAILHAFGNDKTIDQNQPLLLDVGAEYSHYSADIARTWSQKPTKRFLQIYESVKEVADFAFSILKPGVVMRDYEAQIEKFMGEKLRVLGLIRTIERETVREYFPSLTSHFLGIDVHDSGDYDHPIEPGVVITVEPGIYIPQEGLGIRIEDDVLITPDGCENLSKALAR